MRKLGCRVQNEACLNRLQARDSNVYSAKERKVRRDDGAIKKSTPNVSTELGSLASTRYFIMLLLYWPSLGRVQSHLEKAEMVQADRVALAARGAIHMDAASACVGQPPAAIRSQSQLRLLPANLASLVLLAQIQIHLNINMSM